MKTSNTKAENQSQVEAFRRMDGDVLDLISIYAADFREIISEFELSQSRVPSADDLLWIASQHRGHDITKAA